MPQRLKEGDVKVLSFTFAHMVSEFAVGYAQGENTHMTLVNGNNLVRAARFLQSANDKGTDETLTESEISTVENAGRLILASADSIANKGKFEVYWQPFTLYRKSNGAAIPVDKTGEMLLRQAAGVIWRYSKRRDDKFAAMEVGGAALLASVL